MTFVIGIFKKISMCIFVFDEEMEFELDNNNKTNRPAITKELLLKKLVKTLQSIRHNRLSNHLLNQETNYSNPAISFDDPINRLLFESSDGEIADYESSLKSYFDENVCITTNVQNWIDETL